MKKIFTPQETLLTVDRRSPSTLILGGSGSGKTVFLYRAVQTWQERYHAKIFIFDLKDECEPAFMQFDPPERQKRIMAYNGEEELIRRYDVRLNHPFLKKKRGKTSDDGIPSSAIPELNLFTVPLITLGEEEISLITEHLGIGTSNALILNTLNDLSPEDSYYDFLDRLYQRTSQHDTSFESVSEGRALNVGMIKGRFEPCEHYGFLTPATYKRNLRLPDLFRDRDTIEVFSTRYIANKKMRDLLCVWLMKQLKRYAPTYRSPTVLAIDEIAKLCPSAGEGYKKVVSQFVGQFLKEMRVMNIRVIATAQVIKNVATTVQDGFTQLFLGKVASGNERQYYAERFGLSKLDIDRIADESIGTFLSINVGSEPTLVHVQ